MRFRYYHALIIIFFLTVIVSIFFVVRTENPTGETLEEVENNCFGFLVGNPDEEAETVSMIGAGWTRPHPGQFIWGHVEPEQGKFIFRGTDDWVKEIQKNNLAILATIWPYAEWDQESCHNIECKVTSEDEFYPRTTPPEPPTGIPISRCTPCNLNDYKTFVSKIVERYDGDGIDDMPGLKMPIKYWEVLNEPEMVGPELTFFIGSPEEYVEILKASNEAIKTACPSCKVVQAGAQHSMPDNLEWWEEVFDFGGANYFDIANIHYINEGDLTTLNVRDFKELMQRKNIDKPIWVTEAQYDSEEEVRSSVKGAFNAGASKIFFTQFEIGKFGVPKKGEYSNVYDNIISECPNQESSSSNEIIVGQGEKYESIQDAINDASPKDTILVKSGKYKENIEISKSITLSAEDNVILTPADINQPAITVNADNVVITGFIIENVASESGIFLNEVNGCVIKDNSVNFNTWGIVLRSSNNCKIINNSAKNNTGFLAKEGEKCPSEIICVPSSGIQLINSENNILQGNDLLDNPNGIDLFFGSSNNLISNNIVKMSILTDEHSRYNNGIGAFDDSNNNTIKQNLVENYEDCIDLAKSSYAKILDNTVSNCGGAIGLNHKVNYTIIKNNTAKSSAMGILLWNSVSNTAINNNTLINNRIGIRFHNSDGNVINGCLMKDNEFDITSENSNNQIINCEFETHDKDSNSSLNIIE